MSRFGVVFQKILRENFIIFIGVNVENVLNILQKIWLNDLNKLDFFRKKHLKIIGFGEVVIILRENRILLVQAWEVVDVWKIVDFLENLLNKVWVVALYLLEVDVLFVIVFVFAIEIEKNPKNIVGVLNNKIIKAKESEKNSVLGLAVILIVVDLLLHTDNSRRLDN